MIRLNGWNRAAVLLFLATTARIAPAQSFQTIASFDNNNGANPGIDSLVQGTDGALYGTTGVGGANGDGTIFRLASGGMLTTVYSFCSQSNCADGSAPVGLVVGNDRFLYGTTASGGAHGQGTFFTFSPARVLTTLFSFPADNSCSCAPLAAPMQATDGNFYGTTIGGGVYGFGTVFRVTPKGEYTALHSFTFTDGAYPLDNLAQGNDGSLYGTTLQGGINCAPNGCGTVFKVTLGGALKSLYSFCSKSNCVDGANPESGLTLGLDGNFYGTTFAGGTNSSGTVFRVTSNGALTTYSFGPPSADGYSPYGGVSLGTDGNFYGTTETGGDGNNGTIFELSANGTLTTIYDWPENDEAYPLAAPTQATNGEFYGTTSDGGAYQVGSIYRLGVGLGPFVTFVQAAGKVGQTGGILGQVFAGTTSVSLNGTPATFTVVSDTYMRVTVPAGATTGYVTVTTPSGTLTSNVPFRVIP